jgi:hypothetical protein
VSRPFDNLTDSKIGSGVLAAFGAAGGALLALTVLYALGRFWINPWLDSLPHGDTDMFGPPEGWLVVIATVVLGPPIVVIAAWLAMRSARRAWDLDDIRPSRLLFALLACALGGVSLSAIDVLGNAAGLTVVGVAVGVAGFVSSMASRPRASMHQN